MDGKRSYRPKMVYIEAFDVLAQEDFWIRCPPAAVRWRKVDVYGMVFCGLIISTAA